jgi:hypothetical protein
MSDTRLHSRLFLNEELNNHPDTRFFLEPGLAEFLNTRVAVVMGDSTLTKDDIENHLRPALLRFCKEYNKGGPDFLLATVFDKYKAALADIIKN